MSSGSQVGEEEQDLKQDICLPQPRTDIGKLLNEISSLQITLYWLPENVGLWDCVDVSKQ